ncbi:Adenine DNA glycosylase [Linum perenne]
MRFALAQNQIPCCCCCKCNCNFSSVPPTARTFVLPLPVTKEPIFAEMVDSETPNKMQGSGRNGRPKRKSKQLSADKAGVQVVADIEDLFSEEETQKIRGLMLKWYDGNQRELPWRRKEGHQDGKKEEKEKRAYGVWVSEVMLQQTRVQTVLGYYNRWMAKWPTVELLAQASLEQVNEMWAGLGYYRRARFLLEGAKMIVDEGDGFPSTVASLRKVPGIGNYTAGAIASIAFQQVVPLVDGNVIRVLARLKAISANPKDTATVKTFWKLAAQLVDVCRPGDFNQSLMELGATVCTPLNPNCSSCPVSGQCRALVGSRQDQSVLVTDYPAKVVKAKQREEYSAVCVVEILGGNKDSTVKEQSDNRFLLVRRPDEGLLAGLWEFPSVLMKTEADLMRRRKVMDSSLRKSFGLDPKRSYSVVRRENVGEFVHIFSHIRLKVYVELLVIQLKGEMCDIFSQQNNEKVTWKCVDGKDLPVLGLTSGVKKVYLMVNKFKQTEICTSSPTRKKTLKKQRT